MNQMYLIRNELEENLGKKVIIKANKGRKKYITRKGTLESVYPSLFSVSVENGEDKTLVTYTYSDILTETVKIMILDDDVEFNDLKKIS